MTLKYTGVLKSFGNRKIVLLLTDATGWEMGIWEDCPVLIKKNQSLTETPVLKKQDIEMTFKS